MTPATNELFAVSVRTRWHVFDREPAICAGVCDERERLRVASLLESRTQDRF